MAFNRLALLAILSSLLLSGCSGSPDAPLDLTYVQTTAGSNGEFGEPFGIAVADGVAFVSDGESGKLFRLGRDGAAEPIRGPNFHTPSGLAVDAKRLIVADAGSHVIAATDQNGSLQTLAGVPNVRGSADGDAGSATFNGPAGVAIGNAGEILVADTYNDRIRLVKDGVVSTLAGSERGFADGMQARFDTPIGIAAYKANFVVADAGNRRIRVVEWGGKVWTLAGTGEQEMRDGPGMSAAFIQPTAIAVSPGGEIFVADANAIRKISGLVEPQVTTIAGGSRGFSDGVLANARFNRISGLAFDTDGSLLVTDSDNRIVRRLTTVETRAAPVGTLAPYSAEEFRDRAPPRWPFTSPDTRRDIAGTMGEIRGDTRAEGEQLWFHNGLDIAGAYGETVRFIRDEKVLDPMAAENFGTLRELLRMPTLGYIHLRLGRDKDDNPLGDARFLFSRDPKGKPVGVRVPRGTRFSAGDAIGTLNAMNHVHLIAGRPGAEINALAALSLPNLSDTIAPTIESTTLFDEDWRPLQPLTPASPIRLAGKSRVVVRAFDRIDGNPDRRKLGVYSLGHQIFAEGGSPITEIKWTIEFARMPPGRAVRFAYADGSRSGPRGETIFNYIATNSVSFEDFSEGFIDAGTLEPGRYTLRVHAADFFGNTASKDIRVEIVK